MRLRIQWRHETASEPEMFASAFAKPRRGSLPWLGSLAAHGLAAALVYAIATLASWASYDTFDPNGYIAPLRLRTAFYYIPDHPPTPQQGKAQSRPVAAPAARRAALTLEPDPPAPPKFVVQRRFELPPAPARNPKAPVMLQPKIRVKALPQNAPALAFWAQQDTIRKPDPKQFVAPGRVEAQAPPPKLTAPPVLKIPNKELRLADLNVAFSAAALQPPALPVPPSATSPVRTEEGTEGLAAALDALAGQAAVNVISISPALPAQQLLTIPGGLVNAPRANAVGSADRAAPGNAPGSRPAVGNGNGNGTGTGTANGSGRDVAAAMPPIRIEHPPNGKFDVVLMQSAARDDLPELGGILAGNPVYTVYLSVGDRKEWLLEFCVPSAPKPAANPYEVFVDSPAVLAPPYPVLTVIPGAIAKASRSKYVIIHGFLTVTGAFRDAGAPDAKDALAQALLPSLSTWRFRPATRDRQPVEVEILLVVPPES